MLLLKIRTKDIELSEIPSVLEEDVKYYCDLCINMLGDIFEFQKLKNTNMVKEYFISTLFEIINKE